jgi:hypothetical protein
VSPSRDDEGMTGPMDDRAADALLGGRTVEGEPELTGFVADLGALAEALPTPSPALAALLEDGIVHGPLPVAAPAAVRRSWFAAPLWARGALVGAMALAAVLSAAAGDLLPGRAQDAVADVVGWVTPVDLPRSDDPLPVPSPSATRTPEPDASEDAGHGAVEPGDDKGSSGSDDSTSGGSGSDDSTSGGSGSDDGTTGSTSSGSGSGGSDDSTPGTSSGSGSGGSDDRSPSPSPTPRESESPKPSPSPTPTESGGSDDH